MVYVTGDIHGDIERFHSPAFNKLKKGDTLIVCGDFGFVWDDSKKEKKTLKWLGKRKYNIAFVDGCHDNYSILNSLEESEWCGGKVHNISGRLYHLIRGGVFTIEDEKYFVFGGGESDDYEERVTANKWWKEEQPTKAEVAIAEANLQAVNYNVDFVITHDAPRALNGVVDIDADKHSFIHMFLDSVCKKCKFSVWYFGKYHMDKIVPPRYRAMFHDLVPVRKVK